MVLDKKWLKVIKQEGSPNKSEQSLPAYENVAQSYVNIFVQFKFCMVKYQQEKWNFFFFFNLVICTEIVKCLVRAQPTSNMQGQTCPFSHSRPVQARLGQDTSLLI